MVSKTIIFSSGQFCENRCFTMVKLMFFKVREPPKSVKKRHRKKVVPNCIPKWNFEQFERFRTPKLARKVAQAGPKVHKKSEKQFFEVATENDEVANSNFVRFLAILAPQNYLKNDYFFVRSIL